MEKLKIMLIIQELLRICIVVRILWPGGVQRIAFAEAEGLKKLNNEVDLVFIRAAKEKFYDSSIDYKILYESDINNRFLGRIFKKITLHYLPQRGEDATIDIDLIYKFERTLKNKYDIVYYFDEFSSLFQRHRKTKYKRVVLIHEVSLYNKSFLIKLIQRRAVKRSDLVLTNTAENLGLLHKYGLKNAEEVYPGLWINNDIPGFDKRENIAISVTMWDYGRRPELFLEIAKRLKKGKIILAGSWADLEYFDKFKEKINFLGLGNRLFVTGGIKEQKLNELYKKSKVALRFGYFEKGPGMGSLEYISWGIPLIINSGIGIKEVVKNEINGYIIDEIKFDYAVQLIESLFEDSERWTDISKNNILLAEALSWDKHCSKLNEIFQKLISKDN